MISAAHVQAGDVIIFTRPDRPGAYIPLMVTGSGGGEVTLAPRAGAGPSSVAIPAADLAHLMATNEVGVLRRDLTSVEVPTPCLN